MRIPIVTRRMEKVAAENERVSRLAAEQHLSSRAGHVTSVLRSTGANFGTATTTPEEVQQLALRGAIDQDLAAAYLTRKRRAGWN